MVETRGLPVHEVSRLSQRWPCRTTTPSGSSTSCSISPSARGASPAWSSSRPPPSPSPSGALQGRDAASRACGRIAFCAPVIAAAVLLACLPMVRHRFVERPDIVLMVFLAFTIYALERLSPRRPTPDLRPARRPSALGEHAPERHRDRGAFGAALGGEACFFCSGADERRGARIPRGIPPVVPAAQGGGGACSSPMSCRLAGSIRAGSRSSRCPFSSPPSLVHPGDQRAPAAVLRPLPRSVRAGRAAPAELHRAPPRGGRSSRP